MSDGIGGIGKQIGSELKQVAQDIATDVANIPGEIAEGLLGGGSSDPGAESGEHVSQFGGNLQNDDSGKGGTNQGAMLKAQKEADRTSRMAQIRKNIAQMQQEDEVIQEEKKRKKLEDEQIEEMMKQEEEQQQQAEQVQRARLMNGAQAYMHDSQGSGEGMGTKRKG